MKSWIDAVFPPTCLHCDARVQDPFALCGSCWARTPFIRGSHCDACGCELPGQQSDGELLICEQCHSQNRPWHAARAVMVYRNVARQLVLALKYQQRADIARAAGPWLRQVSDGLVSPSTLVLPIPWHWTRNLRRRLNPAACLAFTFASCSDLEFHPKALRRIRQTSTQAGKTRSQRLENVQNAFAVSPRFQSAVQGRDVVLVDDVFTTGATFGDATRACLEAGARSISVLALARAYKSSYIGSE